jgi:hypothetical protein
LDAALAESVGSVVGPIMVLTCLTLVLTALMARTRGNCSMVVGSMVVDILVAACMGQEMVG